ncbi:LysM peptidoglycan-binding domain-containing protein [Salidesulfovibrio brasiliensis]|uniref:LysM peptidoglycan-binding domain-containing protein n=1 Tax=Salidesulfovibrio brasiliensis TaxID=221711 RepID=UPI0006D0EE6F|nr:LysM peptidoglycan-binding domain-containing protein [Salidesulfovibrio brasiliensis]
MKKLLLLAIACMMIFAWGCSKKVNPEPEVVVVEEETVVEEVVVDPMAVYKSQYDSLPTMHTVAKGECLWWIAEYKQIYNDPFMWPLIFKANRDKIDNPDLIYPGQQFEVPRYGYTLDEVKEARKSAGAPWKQLEPGPDTWIPAEMRAALGYSF